MIKKISEISLIIFFDTYETKYAIMIIKYIFVFDKMIFFLIIIYLYISNNLHLIWKQFKSAKRKR